MSLFVIVDEIIRHLALILFRYILRLATLPKKLGISLISTTKWDAFLTMLPGLLMVGHGTKLLEDKNQAFYLDIICNNSACTVSLLPKLLVGIGIILVFAGTFRFSLFTLQTQHNTFLYIALQVLLMLINILYIISMAGALDNLIESIEKTMLGQLALVHQKDNLFAQTSLVESWDHVQMKMECCGVNSFKDYLDLPGFATAKDAVPRTCCKLATKGNLLVPENVAQCQMDAKMNVHGSQFLSTKGCHEELQSWLYVFVHKTNSLFIGTIFCQMKCCGVNSFKDYLDLPGFATAKDAVPRTCCKLATKGNLLVPENVAQCQMDAKMNVHGSQFLSTKGCHEELQSWLYVFVHKTNSLFIGTIFCQGLAAAHAFWVFIQYSGEQTLHVKQLHKINKL